MKMTHDIDLLRRKAADGTPDSLFDLAQALISGTNTRRRASHCASPRRRVTPARRSSLRERFSMDSASRRTCRRPSTGCDAPKG